MSTLIVRDCDWCGAHVPHAADRDGGPVAHVRATTTNILMPVLGVQKC